MSPGKREDIGELLSAYLDGEATDEQRAQVEALLETDADARALLVELEQAAGALRALPREAAPPSVSESIGARLEREELLGPADRQVTLERHKRGAFRSSLAVAAILIIAVGGVMYVSFELTRAPTPSTKQLARGRSPQPAPDDTKDTMTAERRAGKGTAPTPHPRGDWDALKRKLTQPETELQESLAEVVATSVATKPAVESEEVAADRVAAVAKDVTRGPRRSVEEEVLPPAPLLLDDPRFLLGGSMTFEQQLAAGKGLATIKTHRFENEPLQLAITFAGAERQDDFEGRLRVFFREKGLADLDRAPRAGDLMMGRGVAGLLDLQSGEDAAPPEVSRIFYEGVPEHNFAPRSPGEQRYIVRVPTAAVSELIALATAENVEGIRFGIGALTGEGASAAQRLAGRLSPAEVESPEAAEPVDAPGDMLALLEKVGLVPAGLPEDRRGGRGARARRLSDEDESKRFKSGALSGKKSPSPTPHAAIAGEVASRAGRIAKPDAALEQLVTLVIQMAPVEPPRVSATPQPTTVPARNERNEQE